VLFPPTEELLDVPAELVDKGNLLSSQVESVRGDIVLNVINTVTNDTNRFLGLVLAFGAEQGDYIKKDMTFFRNRPILYDSLSGTLFDPNYEVAFLGLVFIKVLVALVIAVSNHCLARLNEFFHKRSLVGFAGTQTDALRNAMIQVESQMDLGLFDTVR
jgi:hypothetical protein